MNMNWKIRCSTLVAVVAATTAIASTALAQLPGLPQQVSPELERLAPRFGFDDDACFPAAAISPDGVLNRGLKIGGSITGECREPGQLEEANTYCRRVSLRLGDTTYSASVYSLYAEKDQVTFSFGGHRHDFESVIVWQTNGQISHASFSSHGGFDVHARERLAFRDGRVAGIYHKDWYATHLMRSASRGEASSNRFFYTPKLVDVDLMKPALRSKLASHDWGKAMWPLDGEYFWKLLGRGKPAGYPEIRLWRSKDLRKALERGQSAPNPLVEWFRNRSATRPSDLFRNK